MGLQTGKHYKKHSTHFNRPRCWPPTGIKVLGGAVSGGVDSRVLTVPSAASVDDTVTGETVGGGGKAAGDIDERGSTSPSAGGSGCVGDLEITVSQYILSI